MDADPRDALIEQLQAENASLREIVRQLTERMEHLEREAHRQAPPFPRKDQDMKPPDQHKRPGKDKRDITDYRRKVGEEQKGHH